MFKNDKVANFRNGVPSYHNIFVMDKNHKSTKKTSKCAKQMWGGVSVEKNPYSDLRKDLKL